MADIDPSRPESLYTVVCRPALPRDTPDVIELTSTIWGGEDYVPHVWEDWLKDEAGLLAVAEYGGRAIGLSKLTRLDERQWWLEGLRVHPAYEGRGVASHLHDYLVEHWLAQYSGVLRLATASFRKPVQHLSERSGFRLVMQVSSYRAGALDGRTTSFTPVQVTQLEEAARFARGSPLAAPAGGLINADFHWSEPSAATLAGFLTQERAWWWRGREGLLLATEEEDGGVLWAMAGGIFCQPGDLPEMLAEYRRLAGSLAYPYAAWAIPSDPALLDALEAAGFLKNWGNSVYIYEKHHPTMVR